MDGCTLRFTQNSPLQTTLIDEVTGHAKYQIDTPMTVARATTRIRKFKSPTQPPVHWNDHEDSSSGDGVIDQEKKKKSQRSDTKEGDGVDIRAELPETSAEIARIYWKWFSSDRIIFRGRVYRRTGLLPKCGRMKGSYLFTGPDGVQYRWALGALGLCHPKLVTTDKKKTLIAEFHPARYLMKRRQARLEVQPAGMDMLDHIILTFVFAENKRRERQAVPSSSGHGV